MTGVAEFSEKLDGLVRRLETKVLGTAGKFDNLATNVEHKDVEWNSPEIPAFGLIFKVLITGGFVEEQLDEFASILQSELSREVSAVDKTTGRASTPEHKVKAYIEVERAENPQVIVKFRYSNQ